MPASTQASLRVVSRETFYAAKVIPFWSGQRVFERFIPFRVVNSHTAGNIKEFTIDELRFSIVKKSSVSLSAEHWKLFLRTINYELFSIDNLQS